MLYVYCGCFSQFIDTFGVCFTPPLLLLKRNILKSIVIKNKWHVIITPLPSFPLFKTWNVSQLVIFINYTSSLWTIHQKFPFFGCCKYLKQFFFWKIKHRLPSHQNHSRSYAFLSKPLVYFPKDTTHLFNPCWFDL